MKKRLVFFISVVLIGAFFKQSHLLSFCVDEENYFAYDAVLEENDDDDEDGSDYTDQAVLDTDINDDNTSDTPDDSDPSEEDIDTVDDSSEKVDDSSNILDDSSNDNNENNDEDNSGDINDSKDENQSNSNNEAIENPKTGQFCFILVVFVCIISAFMILFYKNRLVGNNR